MRHGHILSLIAGAAVLVGHALGSLLNAPMAAWSLVFLVACAAAGLIYLLLRRWLLRPLAAFTTETGIDPLDAIAARLQRGAETEARLAELEQTTSMLRHDLRGILSPALLIADRLLTSQDSSIRRAGEVVVRTVERANERLDATKRAQPGGQVSPHQTRR